jgi:hypothetical protein
MMPEREQPQVDAMSHAAQMKGLINGAAAEAAQERGRASTKPAEHAPDAARHADDIRAQIASLGTEEVAAPVAEPEVGGEVVEGPEAGPEGEVETEEEYQARVDAEAEKLGQERHGDIVSVQTAIRETLGPRENVWGEMRAALARQGSGNTDAMVSSQIGRLREKFAAGEMDEIDQVWEAVIRDRGGTLDPRFPPVHRGNVVDFATGNKLVEAADDPDLDEAQLERLTAAMELLVNYGLYKFNSLHGGGAQLETAATVMEAIADRLPNFPDHAGWGEASSGMNIVLASLRLDDMRDGSLHDREPERDATRAAALRVTRRLDRARAHGELAAEDEAAGLLPHGEHEGQPAA